VPGRTGNALRAWLAARPERWKAQILTASLDPFRGYATALADQLPTAIRVLDPFHVCKLALDALDEVRRRVQQDTLGRRGHRDDPLYRTRRLLRRRADRLTDRAWTRLTARLTDGDPDGEVTAAWAVAQDVMAAYAANDVTSGRARAAQAIEAALSCPVPEVARLGRTLRAWRTELLAYFSTERATSNGPTEAVNLLIETSRPAPAMDSAISTTTDCDSYLPTASRLAIVAHHGSEGPRPRFAA
jgi:transposase